MSKWPPFGLSKGHFEEAGYNLQQLRTHPVPQQDWGPGPPKETPSKNMAIFGIYMQFQGCNGSSSVPLLGGF